MRKLFAPRTVLAFLIAPISPGLLIYLLWVFSGSNFPSQGTFFLKFSSIFAYPVAIIVGIPLYLLFAWRGWSNLIAYIICGVLLGSITFSIFISMTNFSAHGVSGMAGRLNDLIIESLFGGLIFGSLPGLVFWLIARPDQWPIRASGYNKITQDSK